VIDKGVGDSSYRIARRQLLQAGVRYELCDAGSSVCPAG
jgi:hypothetical protein